MSSADEWKTNGRWYVAGGFRVDVSEQEPEPELVIRYSESDFFTQVRLPFEKLRELVSRVGYDLSRDPSLDAAEILAWKSEAWKLFRTAPGIVCRGCGCRDEEVCRLAGGQHCHWIRPGLCSGCVQKEGKHV